MNTVANTFVTAKQGDALIGIIKLAKALNACAVHISSTVTYVTLKKPSDVAKLETFERRISI